MNWSVMNSEYQRRQAEACIRIARGSFDLSTAERLRHMATALQTKADELQQQEEKSFERM